MRPIHMVRVHLVGSKVSVPHISLRLLLDPFRFLCIAISFPHATDVAD